MDQPLISIIVPTYNRLYPLGELAEALHRQTFNNFEAVIINDHGASVDTVRERYPELAINIIDLEANVRDVQARNIGLQHARGRYIMLVDDDDLIVPDHLETMLKAIEGYDFVYSDAEIFDYTTVENVRIPTTRRVFAYEHNLEAIRTYSTFIPTGCLYKREIHNIIGAFDTSIANHWDWDFFLRVLERFQVKRVHRAGSIYAFSAQGDNMSGDHQKMRESLNRLSEKHNLGDLPTKNFFVLLEEPDLKRHETSCEIVWDGRPIRSRLVER
jgi:glycosyltransferase involved in cell wall biosynthesis